MKSFIHKQILESFQEFILQCFLICLQFLMPIICNMSFIDFVFEALNFENYSDLFNIASILVCSTGFLANVVSNCIAIPIIPIVSCALKRNEGSFGICVRNDFYDKTIYSKTISVNYSYITTLLTPP